MTAVDVAPSLAVDAAEATDLCSVCPCVTGPLCEGDSLSSGSGGKPTKKEKSGKTLLETTDLPTACSHNRWTLHIKTKRFYMFRCMVCSKLWKTKFKTTQKCLEFFMGYCPLGDACPKPHIYSKNRKGIDVHTSLESFRGVKKEEEEQDKGDAASVGSAARSDPGLAMTELAGIVAAVAAQAGDATLAPADSGAPRTPDSPPPLDDFATFPEPGPMPETAAPAPMPDIDAPAAPAVARAEPAGPALPYAYGTAAPGARYQAPYMLDGNAGAAAYTAPAAAPAYSLDAPPQPVYPTGFVAVQQTAPAPARAAYAAPQAAAPVAYAAPQATYAMPAQGFVAQAPVTAAPQYQAAPVYAYTYTVAPAGPTGYAL
eukprot:TRINITY_DN6009_c0_g1_i1.p1 TRINITY_DN6009_c0_g1~~TRINITY_DN6009_c0_g1_i1.p1  ORF type:complete len:371 (+),score=87.71 TRINITY_DN6009_c0_g1_i1:60-1172(+)